jgi:hypothetical protein
MAPVHLEADVTRHSFPLTAELPNRNAPSAFTAGSRAETREMLVNYNGLAGNVAIASPSHDQVFAAAPRTQDSVSIDMALAREGAAIAAAIGRREQLQYFEDLIADALYDHETGVVSHRRQAEAVLASLLNAGVVR